MLDGVTPVPSEFAARYRERGYWEDRPLFEGFTGALAKYADRVALVDEAGPVTYRRAVRPLGPAGPRPARRWASGRWTGSSSSCRTRRCSPTSTSRCSGSGPRPVLALPGHRRREITQFAEISGRGRWPCPRPRRGFDFTAMAAEVMAANPALGLCFVQGADGPARDTAGSAVRAPGGPAGTRAAGIRAGTGRASASTRPTRRCSCSPAAPPGSPSSSPGPTTTTCTTRRSPRRCARSARATCCSTCCRSSTTCRSAARACRAFC